MINKLSKLLMATLIFMGGISFFTSNSHAASCCGGGSASSLIMPKFSKAMVDVSFDIEDYDGFWKKSGEQVDDPAGSDYKQYRLNVGYGLRLAKRWQASLSVPYVRNDNKYSGEDFKTNGLGDMTLNVWYETFDAIQCVWEVNSIEDLKPATYLGLSLTLPTGISPYGDVKRSEDVTGRGFYRLDGTVLFDKTIYPFTSTLLLSYGKHLERTVNRTYGNYEEPYHKKLGDRLLGTLSFSYSHFLENMDSMTYTAAYSDLQEEEGSTLDGEADPTTGMRKRSIAYTIAHSTMDRDWITKVTYSRALSGKGENFPITNVISVGVSHVFR